MNHPLLLIAMQEFTLNRRNKWVTSFAGLFAFLTLFISYFGMVTSGYSGFQDFARTSTSLINLTGFVIPLFALLLGVFSFISNREYLELLVAQPISRMQVLMGKYLGLLLTLLITTIAGFSIPGILISFTIGPAGILSYVTVILFSLLLAVVFSGCAILIAQIANRQQIALGVAISVWIFFEVVYGLAMLGATLYLSPAVLKSVLTLGLLGNPIDVFRVLSLLAVGGAEFFGPAGATLMKLVGSEAWAVFLGLAALLTWSVLPVVFAMRLFSRQNL